MAPRQQREPVILDPFKSDEIRHIGNGGFSVVHEVVVYSPPAYGGDGSFDTYARKRMKKKEIDAVKFAQELSLTLNLHELRHVVNVHRRGEDAEHYYIYMKPVAKYDLGTWLRHVNERKSGSALNQDRTREIIKAFMWIYCLTHTFSVIHDSWIVHRDIKPENILVARNDSIVISDFGMSMIFADDRTPESSRTLVNARYAPPESRRYVDKKTKKLCEYRFTNRGDVFSLGCVFLEILKALCRNFNITFPRQYPHALHEKFADAVKTSGFGEAMLSINMETPRTPPFHQGWWLMFIKSLITYIITHMVRERVEDRSYANSVASDLKNLMSECGVTHPSCCPQELQ